MHWTRHGRRRLLNGFAQPILGWTRLGPKGVHPILGWTRVRARRVLCASFAWMAPQVAHPILGWACLGAEAAHRILGF